MLELYTTLCLYNLFQNSQTAITTLNKIYPSITKLNTYEKTKHLHQKGLLTSPIHCIFENLYIFTNRSTSIIQFWNSFNHDFY